MTTKTAYTAAIETMRSIRRILDKRIARYASEREARQRPVENIPLCIKIIAAYRCLTDVYPFKDGDAAYEGSELYYGDIPAPEGSTIKLFGDAYFVQRSFTTVPPRISSKPRLAVDIFHLVDGFGGVIRIAGKVRKVKSDHPACLYEEKSSGINLLAGKFLGSGLTYAQVSGIMNSVNGDIFAENDEEE